MKVLITGAKGFIGKNLLNSLNKDKIVVPFSRQLGMEYGSISFQWLNDNKIDAIVHLAGIAHDIQDTLNENLYYQVNTNLTQQLYDAFLKSNTANFIFLSSVKAVADTTNEILSEEVLPNPKTVYGKSKRQAEIYIEKMAIQSTSKFFYILRPPMVYGPGNKGNLNLLYKIVKKGIPWPLATFSNQRSFCSIDNLVFVINELLTRKDIPSGVYNVADDQSISTNELLQILGESINRKSRLLKVPRSIIKGIASMGNFLQLPLNGDRLRKLTESYVVSNKKISKAIGKPFPMTAKLGLMKTFKSFDN